MPSRRHCRLFAALLLAAAPAFAAAPALVEEVPFITSPDQVTLEMLRIANVGASDHVVDLGSGDGRIVVTAARRFGASGLGVEIVPELVERSRRAAREAGVEGRVEFREQDLFQADLSRATVVTMYLLPEFNLRLRPRLLQLRAGTRIVSHDWDLGDWRPDRTTVVDVPDKPVGREKLSRVHLWVVPARVDGLWCGVGALSSFSLRLSQRYQAVTGELVRKDRTRALEGRLDGAVLRMAPTAVGSLELTHDAAEDRLRVTGGEGRLALVRGTSFRRAEGGRCGA